MFRATLRKWWDDKGLVVSASAHAVLLGATLVAFSRTPPFEDAAETVPVEMITDAQLNQIMKGEKTAKAVKPTPKVDKVADVSEHKPLPPTPEAKKDVPTPPPPLKRLADPGEDDKPEQKEPQKVAALPPPRPTPEPPKLEPKPEPKPEAKPEPPTPPARPQAAKPAPEEKPEPEDAEPIRPKPVERPKDLAKEQPKPDPKPELKPDPKPEAKPEAKHVPTPPQPPRPQLKVDEVAKLLEHSKTPDPKAKADKPVSKPRSGDEDQPKSSLDLSAISKLLDHDKPARMASTGAHLQQTASLGSPTASAAKMSPSLWAGLDSLMQERYRQCWTYLGLAQGQKYVPQVRVRFQPDGSLAAEPAIVNPPSDPAQRGLAESAIRAVRKCNPMQIPAQYQPYYEQWKARVVRFDPDEMT